MNVPPTPTSPKARVQHQSQQELESLLSNPKNGQIVRPPRPRRLSIGTLLLSLVVGFSAGILGELVFNAYLLDEESPLLRIIQQRSFPTQPLTRNRATRQTEEALIGINRALLGIIELPPLEGTTADAVDPERFIGTAAVLTDDGWAVTAANVLETERRYAAVTADRRVLEVKHPVRDPAADLTFFRIDGGNYPVISLGAAQPVSGEYAAVLSASSRQTVYRAREVAVEDRQARAGGVLELSDDVTRLLRLDRGLPLSFRGGPIVDARGRVFGLVTAAADDAGPSAVVLEARFISRVLPVLLSSQTVRRPVLGVRYLDIAATPGIPETLRFRRDSGALIAGSDGEPAIVPNSPAEHAGLRSGDLILRVDDQWLTEQAGLSGLIQDSLPGAIVTLTILRSGEEQIARITLESQLPD